MQDSCTIPEVIKAGLTDKTLEVFDAVSRLECIKGLYLCGGTGQSIQQHHRLSEDLDFELIGIKRERPNLDLSGIIKETETAFPDTKAEILGEDHLLMYINGGTVKLSFYRPENQVKAIHDGLTYRNLKAPTLQDLLGMKVYTVCLRSTFRDYYDIYCLLEAGCTLDEAISYASYLSRHRIKSKYMFSRLLSPRLYIKEDFDRMHPKYPNLTSDEICEFIKKTITVENKAALDAKIRQGITDLQ